jgi:hypothetical protein
MKFLSIEKQSPSQPASLRWFKKRWLEKIEEQIGTKRERKSYG